MLAYDVADALAVVVAAVEAEAAVEEAVVEVPNNPWF